MYVIKGVELKGVCCSVPVHTESNLSLDMKGLDNERLISTTGIKYRRIAGDGICASDLCLSAANRLLASPKFDVKDIDVMVFVTQTPDYSIPSTAHILQNKLDLRKNCIVLEVSEGCSGFVNGIFNIAAILSGLQSGKGLLLVGDTISKICGVNDKSTRPLFGDAGSASIFEFTDEGELVFDIGGDGKSYKDIIVKDGGSRHQFSQDSLLEKSDENGVSLCDSNLSLDGMNVFMFGITKAPESVKRLCSESDVDMESIDYFVFHQANMFMNEKIRKKLKIGSEKVAYSLENFGNTSSASIPITLTSQLGEKLRSQKNKLLLCGFGVGVSWASVLISTSDLVCPEIVEI